MRFPQIKLNNNWLLLGAAVLLGSGAVYLSNSLIRNKMAELEEQAKRGTETVKVVVAKRDMERGEPVDGEAMAVRDVPREFVHANAVRPEDFGNVERQRLVTPMKRGEVLLPVHTEGAGTSVFSATLKKGHRALTFAVDEVNSISGMLRPGDFIDLIYSSKANAQLGQEQTRPLLSQVQVLATGQTLSKRDEQTGADRSFSTITLEVSPADAQRIIVAKSAGQLTAVLRHPEDTAANRTAAISELTLFGASRSAGLGPTIEYIVGGGGQGSAEIQLAQVARTLPGLLSPVASDSRKAPPR